MTQPGDCSPSTTLAIFLPFGEAPGESPMSKASTEHHIDKITSYEHFSKDFIPSHSLGSMKLRMNALSSGFGSGIDGRPGGMNLVRNHPVNI